MFNIGVGHTQTGEEGKWSAMLRSSALITAGMLVLVVVGMILAALLGGELGTLGRYAAGAVLFACMIAIIVILRWDELAATAVLAVQLYVDFYLGLHIISQVMILLLLVVYYLARSPQRPWIRPYALWLWVLFLALAIFPAIRGATNAYNAATYYPNIIFGALSAFWLGSVIARDTTSVGRFFKILAAFSTCLAGITLIQAMTGTLLFGSSDFEQILVAPGISASRLGSFFFDPNWNGTFFAMMIFIPLGLFFKSQFFLEKVLYLAEMLIMLPALLFTYSIGAWVSAIVGAIVFTVLVGRVSYWIWISLIVTAIITALLALFPSEVTFLLRHASDPSEVSLRIGAWQTALRVIQASPLTGVGLGLDVYLQRSNPYRVPAQYVPLAHPHNSYLELAAMAGIPLLITFVALILFVFWQALCNWAQADPRNRCLFSAGIVTVIALSVNSVSINGWTLPPLAATGWLILGVISSPLLRKKHPGEKAEESNPISQKSQ
jgi:O-antigen ligase